MTNQSGSVAKTGDWRAAVVISAVAAVFLLAGCAPKQWTKEGASAEQVEQDKARCTREFLTPGAGGAVRNKGVEPACMEKLGYVKR